MTKDEILLAALALPEHEREDLAYALLESISADAASGLSYASLQEMERRIRDVEAALEKTVPWEELKARLELNQTERARLAREMAAADAAAWDAQLERDIADGKLKLIVEAARRASKDDDSSDL